MDFILVGSTAIEDKLQDEVGPVIDFIKQAGIKLWVLTGDKIETAINIGFSCKLLDQEMEIFIIESMNSEELKNSINDYLAKQKKIGFTRDTAVVLGGDQLSLLTRGKNRHLMDEFMKLAQNSSVVLACRVSPKQKAEVVLEVRKQNDENKTTTLAIGDGANDVNMITSAHIGIGISGLEG